MNKGAHKTIDIWAWIVDKLNKEDLSKAAILIWCICSFCNFINSNNQVVDPSLLCKEINFHIQEFERRFNPSTVRPNLLAPPVRIFGSLLQFVRGS